MVWDTIFGKDGWKEGVGNAGNAGLGRGQQSSCSGGGGGGQAAEPGGMHRKEDNFKGSPQAHPREKLGEGDAREETSCQSLEERRGKVQCHGNQRGSMSISRKSQLQGSGVEQGVGSLGHLPCEEGLVLTFHN